MWQFVGLCFSDLKLLKQFSAHATFYHRRHGLRELLRQMPSHVPRDQPGHPPGHVHADKVGGCYLVQTDYRWLPTANSCSAFGYNFEGALRGGEDALVQKDIFLEGAFKVVAEGGAGVGGGQPAVIGLHQVAPADLVALDIGARPGPGG